MTINLEILEASLVYAPVEIEILNTKELVPKMMIRRRLTRAAKIAIYLANKVQFSSGRVVYGSSFGELNATANILNSIHNQESISPTHFQNSVYNTAVSYLSLLNSNHDEIVTLSSGDKTALNILKSGAIKALDGKELLLLATETLNIEKIDELNHCIDYLEVGVAFKVRCTEEEATLDWENTQGSLNVPKSLKAMVDIAQSYKPNQKNIITVLL